MQQTEQTFVVTGYVHDFVRKSLVLSAGAERPKESHKVKKREVKGKATVVHHTIEVRSHRGIKSVYRLLVDPVS